MSGPEGSSGVWEEGGSVCSAEEPPLGETVESKEDTSSSLLDIQEEGSGSWTAQAHRKHAEASRKPMRRTRGFRMPFRPFRKIARRLCPGLSSRGSTASKRY